MTIPPDPAAENADVTIEFIDSLRGIDADVWNSLWPSDYPFTRHEYLLALEHSGCVTAATGWHAQHCLMWQGRQLIAALPLYLKTHSYGEYVFDWSWANAYQHHGLDYYPKLLNAIPFTPATGPRWGFAASLSTAAKTTVIQRLDGALRQALRQLGCSGLHCLFLQGSLLQQLNQGGAWIQRLDCQFHWFNQSYSNFDEFLQTFAGRKRKNINKERSKVLEQGFQIKMTPGADLSPADWQTFYQLYRRTYLKRSGHNGYLNAAFFLQIGQNLPQHVVVAQAFHNGQWVAAALYFQDNTTLYGRYWGAIDEFDGLHFECCYYQGIEYAIRRGLSRFDPGAQGEHKVTRGFQPVYTTSLHLIARPDFAQAIRHFAEEEQTQVQHYSEELQKRLPFREGTTLTSRHFLIEP